MSGETWGKRVNGKNMATVNKKTNGDAPEKRVGNRKSEKEK